MLVYEDKFFKKILNAKIKLSIEAGHQLTWEEFFYFLSHKEWDSSQRKK